MKQTKTMIDEEKKEQEEECVATMETTAPKEDEDRTRNSSARAKYGDVVTIDLVLEPEDGFVPEPLFDMRGDGLQLVVGWGNYLPGLHELLLGRRAGDSVSGVSVDAGYGRKRDDLMFRVPKDRLLKIIEEGDVRDEGQDSLFLRVGSTVHLKQNNGGGGIPVLIAEVIPGNGGVGDVVVLYANAPLAGASYSCSFIVRNVETPQSSAFTYRQQQQQHQHPQPHHKRESKYEAATFALGCFWGAELAFMRTTGVVGTRVGYCQGNTLDPTYEQVCTGKTRHVESVMVLYDRTAVSYDELLLVAYDRIATTTPRPMSGVEATTTTTASSSAFENDEDEDYDDVFTHNLFREEDDEDNMQYRLGFYYHDDHQSEVASKRMREMSSSRKYRFAEDIELLPAAPVFYRAEEYHQQYLYKGGQSAKKGCKDTIRCYG